MNLMRDFHFYLHFNIYDILFRGSYFSQNSRTSGSKLIAGDLNGLLKIGLDDPNFICEVPKSENKRS